MAASFGHLYKTRGYGSSPKRVLLPQVNEKVRRAFIKSPPSHHHHHHQGHKDANSTSLFQLPSLAIAGASPSPRALRSRSRLRPAYCKSSLGGKTAASSLAKKMTRALIDNPPEERRKLTADNFPTEMNVVRNNTERFASVYARRARYVV